MSKKVILRINLYHYQSNEGYKMTGPHLFHLHGSPHDFNTFMSIIVIVNAIHCPIQIFPDVGISYSWMN